MSTPVEVVQDFVATFIAAWPERDAARLASFFSEDAVYHNMPMEPVNGREAIQAALAAFMEMGGRVDVDMRHIVADGAVVMTERVDHFIRPGMTISLPVAGIFEIRSGAISAWREYFDLNQLRSQMPDEA